MRLHALAWALPAILLLAGCASKPADGPARTSPSPTSAPAAALNSPTQGPGPANPAASPNFVLQDCRNFGGVFPVPLASAKAVLPEGFEPVPASSDATSATLYVLGLRCDESSVAGSRQGAADLAYAELAVVPSARYVVPGVSDYTVPVFFTTSQPALAQALSAGHLGLSGAGTADWVEHTGAGDVIVAASVGGASLTLRGVLSPAPPTSLSSGRFVVFGVQDGVVRAIFDATSAAGSAVDAGVTLQAADAPAPLADARPAARGFSVSGFTLGFAPRSLPS